MSSLFYIYLKLFCFVLWMFSWFTCFFKREFLFWLWRLHNFWRWTQILLFWFFFCVNAFFFILAFIFFQWDSFSLVGCRSFFLWFFSTIFCCQAVVSFYIIKRSKFPSFRFWSINANGYCLIFKGGLLHWYFFFSFFLCLLNKDNFLNRFRLIWFFTTFEADFANLLWNLCFIF